MLPNIIVRQAHISPKKKVSWRLTKKWFNRYEKPLWLNHSIMAVSKDGKTQVPAQITHIQIHKAGGHNSKYSLTAAPIWATNSRKNRCIYPMQTI